MGKGGGREVHGARIGYDSHKTKQETTKAFVVCLLRLFCDVDLIDDPWLALWPRVVVLENESGVFSCQYMVLLLFWLGFRHFVAGWCVALTPPLTCT